jgi:hypothetical protein
MKGANVMATTNQPEAIETPETGERRTNGLTEEQKQKLIAGIGRRRDDPEYVRRLVEGAREYRRQVQEEYELTTAEEEVK